MIVRVTIAAFAGALALGTSTTSFAQNGYGSAASVAASVGATASPPFAGGAVSVPAARPVDDTVFATGSIERMPRGASRRPHR